jgi:hypothetical protein
LQSLSGDSMFPFLHIPTLCDASRSNAALRDHHGVYKPFRNIRQPLPSIAESLRLI